MKTTGSNNAKCGLTLIEVLVVIGVAVVLFGLLLPVLVRRTHPRASRINCTSNLKQVGMAFRMWSSDRGDQFPMAVSTNQEGTREFIGRGEAFRHFMALSNELVLPKVLVCPNDPARLRATNFAQVRNTNVSYFVSLDAEETKPLRILSGDRNITGGTVTQVGITYFRTNSLADWTSELHSRMGNLGFANGSAQQVNGVNLRQLLQQQGREFIRLELPETTR